MPVSASVFADFRRSTGGKGTSFKGALAYYLNDKGKEGERLDTDERVDVLELRNLVTEDARDAWFEMMNTAEASAALKEAAGIRKGGRAGAQPVFTYYLGWHDSETPDRAAMLDAARSTIRLLGLEHHQAVVVSHSDTQHRHVHVIVNRVDPQTGVYAALSNNWKALKSWAIDYSKEHGTSWHVPLEQAKQARSERQADKSARQSAFNQAAQARQEQRKPAWQERRDAERAAHRAAEEAAAATLKAQLAARWSALRRHQAHQAERRQREIRGVWEERRAIRRVILEKYREANDALWKQPAAPRRPPSGRSEQGDALVRRMADARRLFERRERSFAGRLANARQLAQGKSLLAVARLAMDQQERRRQFDAFQNKTAARGRQGNTSPVEVRREKFETRRFKSERLKGMRAAELAEFDQETQRIVAGFKARHGEEAENEKAAASTLAAEGRAAWAEHARAHRRPVSRKRSEQGRGRPETGRQADAEQAEQTQETPAEPVKDRYGRNRERGSRQPRPPRQARADRATPTPQPTDSKGRQDGSTQQAANSFNETGRGADPLRQAEAAHVWTPEQREAITRAEARTAAERQANERDPGRDFGRE